MDNVGKKAGNEKIVLSILNIVKTSHYLNRKQIRYEMSLEYEGKIEKLLLNKDSIKGYWRMQRTREKHLFKKGRWKASDWNSSLLV